MTQNDLTAGDRFRGRLLIGLAAALAVGVTALWVALLGWAVVWIVRVL